MLFRGCCICISITRSLPPSSSSSSSSSSLQLSSYEMSSLSSHGTGKNVAPCPSKCSAFLRRENRELASLLTPPFKMSPLCKESPSRQPVNPWNYASGASGAIHADPSPSRRHRPHQIFSKPTPFPPNHSPNHPLFHPTAPVSGDARKHHARAPQYSLM